LTLIRKMMLSDSMLWALTQIFDYTWCGLMLYAVQLIHSGGRYAPLALAWALAVHGAVAVVLLYLRERVYFFIMGERVPAIKQRPLSTKTLYFIFQTYAASTSSFYLMDIFRVVYFTPHELSVSFWSEVFVPFYALLVLRDVVFLAPLHGLLHNRWYAWHKLHHEITRDAQGMHAFHIDLLDLVIENVGAPFLLLAGQYALGVPVGIHWMSALLLTFHDGALHSINPYSVMYYNPLLDYQLQANVHHQLHHALNRGYLMFIPYHHVFKSSQKVDTDKYNSIFKTNFTF